ncbi:glycine--tRNA ligase subunit beta [Persephonella atlantica]|uniref:Glycine--tRNA ligase beta subunit n=1 Tax=Persephonella atlantica TaxID=2699429 RepID=A0ABS1GGW2_9AQUI|nr:glycine--tRNA ligase subunit beta [Persephonella atlantica]MBK3332154.1 glycine--tRNA ligase subunit beta [Persephonella atlantica]
MKNYLLEIGTEELPPKAVEISLNYFSQKLPEIFKNFFEYDTPENIEIFGSPRRIGFLIKNLKEREPSQEKIIVGPPAKVAIDEDGNFTKAALAFASKNNIPVEQLQVIENEKGRYIGAKILIEGKKLEDFIREEIPPLVLSIPFPKTMKWNSSGVRFSRPVRWIVSLLDRDVVEINIGSVKADRYTHLHRFMTEPAGRGEKKEIPEAMQYKEITKLGFVIADFNERKESIKTQLEGFARTLDAQPVIDEELLNEVTNLTEFPIGILGEFSPEYLILPKEVIITVCKVHQRYFNFERDGQLLPRFLAFSNNSVPDRNVVKNGYERVLKARLEDALFFYEEDLKHKLDEFYPKLRDVQFHQKLGSLLDKVERNERIALLLSEHFKDINVEDMVRACRLSKCDILTEMVKEFDELQGIMGMHYALKQGEKEEVAKAIYEHYLPKTADDNLPQTTIGTVLALADKLDTVISFLSIREKPKAAADPYGIRRSAIGIVRLLVEKGIDIDLKEILDSISEEARKSRILKFADIEDNWKVLFDESIIPEILEFITGRFVSYMKDKGYDTDIINAVVSTNSYNLYRNYLKIRTVQQLKKNPQFTDIMTVFKRVGRIIPEGFEGEFSEDFLKEKEERELFEQFQRIKDVYSNEVEKKDYEKALKELLKLKPYIDRFFDNVMVMVEDKRLRENRLSLMRMINRMFKKIADFTKISV